VGLGTGNREQQLSMVAMILEKQERILQQYGPANPLVSVGQYRSTLGRFIEAAGYKDSQEFFKEITPEIDAQLAQPKPPEPSPDMQVFLQQSQLQLETQKQKAMADIQLAREKAAAEIELAREKAAAQIQLDREKVAAQISLKEQEFTADTTLQSAKVGIDAVNSLRS
jgi:hypothetical protein